MPLLILNKPFRVLSQFSADGDRTTLAEFVAEKGVYPAGRLDFDSEGLLLLTDDGRLQAAISSPKSKLAKFYWAQVEGIARSAQLEMLTSGVSLRDGSARALTARLLDTPDGLWAREPPIRHRESVPDSWVELSIDEGRNRQVRRMTAAVKLPTLRLVRHSIGPWSLEGLQPGESRSIRNADAWQQLRDFKWPR